jgi:hypothetical protein
MKLNGEPKGENARSQGGLSGSSLLGSDGSLDSQVGRLEHVSSGQSAAQGQTSGLNPLRSEDFHDGQVGRLDCEGKDTQGS